MPSYARSEPIELDPELLKRVERIKWFSNVGRGVNPSLHETATGLTWRPPIEITCLSSWRAAAANCTNREWEAVTLWFSNELTSFLFDQCHADYNARWNRIARTVNDWFPTTIAPAVREHLNGLTESEVIIRDVHRSIGFAIAEHEYLNCNHPVCFFTSLLELFETGRYPCGWQLPWPDGKLVVF